MARLDQRILLSLTHDVDYIIPPAIRYERLHLAVLHPAHVRGPLPERLPLHVDAILSDKTVPALASGVLAGTGALAVILGVGRVKLVGNARLGHGLQLKSNNKLRGGEDGRRMEEERERTLCLEEEHNKDENYGNDRSSENAPLPQHNHPTTTRPQASPYLCTHGQRGATRKTRSPRPKSRPSPCPKTEEHPPMVDRDVAMSLCEA